MILNRLARAGLLLLACALGPFAQAPYSPMAVAGALPDSCAAPLDLTRLRGKLPRTAMRLARHEMLTIVAVGSSSTEGIGASGPTMTYPAQFVAAVHERLPMQPVTMINKGVGGETAPEMVARFDRDVFAAHPDLVIWQLGTNTVLEDGAIAPMRAVVKAALERLREADIDVVMMDLQYAPMVLSHREYHEMEQTLSLLGKEENVPVFRRFAVMQHWASAEQRDIATMLAPDGLHLNDLGYRCVGGLLAEAVVDTALPSLMMSHR